ncbi:hypothetical protein [Maritimibacter sp. HL-12]|jgi:hypothetical protein|uniref:hypothetical protein n=1 Tax=Maritimibacter sp. HL-12 TaxID=1162418 RepID=UPI000A0F0A86|nr:hypothetical protein [Maritimibacter sp. HL-12]SMH48871.1 hypothetical protein SAMN05661107_2081 [Maritimibacter sp. HL-12]
MIPTTNTAELLVLEAKPRREILLSALATGVFGVLALVFFLRDNDAGVLFLVFAASGPVYAFFFVETRAITLDRHAGRVVIARRGLRGRAEAVHPLDEGARAEVRRAGREGAAVPLDEAPGPGLFRAVLVQGDGGIVPLSETPVDWNEAAVVVRAIEAWRTA